MFVPNTLRDKERFVIGVVIGSFGRVSETPRQDISLTTTRNNTMKMIGSWWRGTRIAILEKEIELAEQKMVHSIAMKPIILYMQKRLEELKSDA